MKWHRFGDVDELLKKGLTLEHFVEPDVMLNNYVISNKHNFSIGVSSSSASVTSC